MKSKIPLYIFRSALLLVVLFLVSFGLLYLLTADDREYMQKVHDQWVEQQTGPFRIDYESEGWVKKRSEAIDYVQLCRVDLDGNVGGNLLQFLSYVIALHEEKGRAVEVKGWDAEVDLSKPGTTWRVTFTWSVADQEEVYQWLYDEDTGNVLAASPPAASLKLLPPAE